MGELAITYLFTGDVVSASFDFAKSTLANVLANRVVTDAPTLHHGLLSFRGVDWHVVSRLGSGVQARDLSRISHPFRMVRCRVRFGVEVGRACIGVGGYAELCE